MMYETFEALFHDALDEFPPEYLQGLSGVHCRREAKGDPDVPGVFRLGEYIRDPHGMGDHVAIYFGSFMRVFGPLPRDEMRKRIFDTIGHEILHHLEHRAGIDDLGDADRVYLAAMRRRFGLDRADGRRLARDLLAALALVVGIACAVLLLGRWFAP